MSKPDFNIDPPKTTAKLEASAGPKLGVEATLYRLIGAGGSAELTANGSVRYETEDQTVGALIKLLFVPAINVFAQPFVKKARKEKPSTRRLKSLSGKKTGNWAGNRS